MQYNRLNNIVGWFVFLIATVVYFMTVEDTASLWDCGEYITAASKLEVGHPPGAPLFMLLGRLSSFLAAPENVAMCINRLSALCSSLTILFMFWSITMLAKKALQRTVRELSLGDQLAIVGSGIVGALAYTFSDSFWFSAVEGEVYAMSSLFTAIIFWAALKWDEEMTAIKHKELTVNHNPLRWIILIMFFFGLAIGVHLLGLLAIPAVVYIIFFNVTEKVKVGSFIIIGLISVIILNLIQNSIIPNIIGNASSFEILFKNTFGLPFNTGTIFYFVLIIFLLLIPFLLKKGNKANIYFLIVIVPLIVLFFSDMSVFMWVLVIINIIVALAVYSSNDNPYQALIFAYFSFVLGPIIYYFAIPEHSFLRKGKTAELESVAYTAMKMFSISLITLLIGYGSFAVIVIRSNANTPLDENDPETLVTLQSYLKREQYGDWPIVYGPYWNSQMSEDYEKFGDLSAVNLRRFVVTHNGEDVKGFKSEAAARKFAGEKGLGYEVSEKYFESNASTRLHQKPIYEQNTLLPRMYWNLEPNKVAKYKYWSGYEDETGEGADGKRLPTFGENMTYMFRYQMNWMYWRYFMWNFAGRQNDIRGHGDIMRGNWLSGVNFIDNSRLGNQEYLPTYTADNESHNRFFFLPLILGLIGMMFHFYRAPKDAFIVLLTFLFTGIAIIFYLNQKPLEPRERDYAFAASFYAFAMWIGLSVLALYEVWKKFGVREAKLLGYIGGGGLVFFLFFGSATLKAWFFIILVIAVLIGIMYFLSKVTRSQAGGAAVAFLLTIFVPVLMAFQGWDDHDRSGKTSARDLAHNYLMSCAQNSVIFTAGDNDTFPLWYYQEVEEKRTDVRVCNLSLMQTDWYTDQMMRKAYESEPMEITFREDQILAGAGNTESILFAGIFDLASLGIQSPTLKVLFDSKVKNNRAEFTQSYDQFRQVGAQVISTLKPKDGNTASRLAAIRNSFNVPADSAEFAVVETMNNGIMEIFQGYQQGLIEGDQQALVSLQQAAQNWEGSWDFMPVKEAMDFVKNDANMVNNNGRMIRVFPTKGFILPINADNAVKSGIITEKERSQCEKEIRFMFRENGIQKEQIMMLDFIANNDWKRAVYYSSPAGQEVAMAILNTGHLRQNGMAWELSPVRSREGINDERMYHNLMEVYTFGDMKNPDVLTDNYARDQTGQMRSQFMQLAQLYLKKADDQLGMKEFYERQIPGLIQSGNKRRADSLTNLYAGTDEKVALWKSRAVKLIHHSLEVMPVENVIDLGEPTKGNDSLISSDGRSYPVYNDGVLHNYVSVLYRAGDKAGAEKLGMKVAAQLESVINFFTHSDPDIAGANLADIASATNNYVLINALANNEQFGDRNSALAKRTRNKLRELYGTTFISMAKALQQMASDNGESVSQSSYMDNYTAMYYEFQGTMDAIGIEGGILKAPANASSSSMPSNNGGGNLPMPSDLLLPAPVADTNRPEDEF